MAFHSFKQKSRRTEDILIKTFNKATEAGKPIEVGVANPSDDARPSPEPAVTVPDTAADKVVVIPSAIECVPVLPADVAVPKPLQRKLSNCSDSGPPTKKIKYEIIVKDEQSTDARMDDSVSVQHEQMYLDDSNDLDLDIDSKPIFATITDDEQIDTINNDAQSADEVQSSCGECQHYRNVRDSLPFRRRCLGHGHSLSRQQKCVHCKARSKNETEFEEHQRQCHAAVTMNDVVEELSESNANCQMFSLDMLPYDNDNDAIVIDNHTDHLTSDEEIEEPLILQLTDFEQVILTETENVRPDSVVSSVVTVQSYNKYECYICNDLFRDRQQYIDHCKEHNVTCIECQLEFESGAELSKHNVDVHQQLLADGSDDAQSAQQMDDIDEDVSGQQQQQQCEICQKTIKSGRANYEFHLLSHESTNIVLNSIEYFPCKYCHTMFAKKDYDSHMSTHDTTIKEECVDYQFLEDEDDIPPCGVCKVEFSSWGNEIKSHLATHMTEFVCPFVDCGCQYNGMLHLTTHIVKKHLNTDEYRCRHCSAEQFETFDELQAHMKHSCAERKFACTHCGKFYYTIPICTSVHIHIYYSVPCTLAMFICLYKKNSYSDALLPYTICKLWLYTFKIQC